MRNLNKIILGLFLTSLIISTFNVQYVAAAEPDDNVEVSGDTVQRMIQAHERVQFRFRKRTQLTIGGNVNISADIECDANNIGDKDVEIDIDAEDDIEMEMVCTEEQKELGLQNGNTYQVRNRNRYRYQEGFCMEIKCNDSCEAELRIEANEQNQNGQWAYYDEDDEEWVTVETEHKDGFLVAKTDHFSTWTLLVPEADYTLIIIGVGVIAAIVIAIVVIIRKRK